MKSSDINCKKHFQGMLSFALAHTHTQACFQRLRTNLRFQLNLMSKKNLNQCDGELCCHLVSGNANESTDLSSVGLFHKRKRQVHTVHVYQYTSLRCDDTTKMTCSLLRSEHHTACELSVCCYHRLSLHPNTSITVCSC